MLYGNNIKIRILKSRLLYILVCVLSGVTAIPLLAILGEVLIKGWKQLGWSFLTEATPNAYKAMMAASAGEAIPGGIANGIIGTFLMLLLAAVVAIPVGILCGICLSEYRKSWFAVFVSYLTDLLQGTPSIIIGIITYIWVVVPMKGYSALIAEMLDHPKIKVLLNTDYASLENKESFERVFYSGPIDEYFGYELGELPYRSLRFDFVEYEREHFQSNSVINYPENHDFTRIGEYKYFLNDKSENTVVSFEYPEAFERGRNDRYYPIVRDENQNLYNRYLEKAKELKNVYFLGRLGDYKYYDMDKAVNRALALFDEVFAKKEKNNAA